MTTSYLYPITVWFGSLVLLAAVPASAQQVESQAGNWQFVGTVGLAYGPEYEGSADSSAGLLLDATAIYKDGLFKVGLGGLEYSPLRSEAGSVAIGLTYGGERDASDYPVNLRGLGDVDAGVLVFLKGEYLLGPVGLGAEITTGSDYGTTVDVSVGSEIPLNERLSLGGAVNMRWADQDYAQTYFGVNTAQSAATGLAAFTPDSGIASVGVSIGLDYAITEKTSASFGVDYTRFRGDIASSPITAEDGQLSAFVGISRSF